ncbi:diaminopimelate epimerase family protein [Mycobacterium xenopi 4042]|uniref:Diaminopimelate epimerase family protein n=1 Tax=Mycobacterium xenopi 4042 TaxID=1299334 RepID=X8CGR6_MYCXE|nr:diaminopimelate epimerase family protein [Mycobacterium xenopi 3993]EUA54470.1 diaminopimelate epimerase family protein [Mycobacterium xenopi 4042]
MRITTAAAAQAAGVLDRLPDGVDAGDWYMDYRNADGSIAQMCGNGARVFAHYLRVSGLERRDEFVVGSLAGLARSRCTTSARATPTSPSTWARPTGSAWGRPWSAAGGSAAWRSMWATRIWRAWIRNLRLKRWPPWILEHR